MVTIHELLKKLVEINASDLHITAGAPPIFRIDGKIQSLSTDILNQEDSLKMCYSLMNELQKKNFESHKEVDFSFGILNLGRFRANVFFQRGAVSMAVRFIPYQIRSCQELGLPDVVEDIIDKPFGLILVTGATGSGKSTTLAAMIDRINSTKQGHILTIEDPIEFLHKHKNCIISQREVHTDTDSFISALRVALRQDPDFVLIGELRDTETMRAALTIAETGHLTLATLHTNSSIQTINRIIDSFPEMEKPQIRTQLSFVLQAVISQALLPQAGGGRVLASEIMVSTPAIRAMIRDDKVHQVQGMLETGFKYGMYTMDACLANLVRHKRVSKSDAFIHCSDKESFSRMLSGK